MANPDEPYKRSVTRIPTNNATCPKKAAFIEELIKRTNPDKQKDSKESKVKSHGRR